MIYHHRAIRKPRESRELNAFTLAGGEGDGDRHPHRNCHVRAHRRREDSRRPCTYRGSESPVNPDPFPFPLCFPVPIGQLFSFTVVRRFSYNEPIRTEALAQATCDLMLSFGESGDAKKMSRPFGVALLLAGCDDLGPKLFFCDPSGTYVEYKAKAIGSGSEGAQAQLTEEYSEGMSLAEAELLAVKTLKAVMEEKLNDDNIEVAKVTPAGYLSIKGEALKALVGRIPI
jgi:hypothetical protein